jgi:nitronate monooxygenase
MARRFRTSLTERLGIEVPIILAPMGAVAGGALAAAVSRAGGLGLIGVGYGKQDWIEREFDAAGNTPVGIGFITWDLARAPARLDVALARKPRAVMLSFGDARPFADRIKASGAALIMQVQSLTGAREAAALGADVIVAQGIEAGGHGGAPGDGRTLLPLVPAVVDAVRPIPVVAAGGIVDGRGLAAALVLGAGGVLMGTRFYAATESLGHANAKRRLVEASADETVRTRIFDTVRAIDWPEAYTGRALLNDFARQWHGREPALETALDGEHSRYASAAAAGDTDTMVVWAGQGVDLIREIQPAGEIVSGLLGEADRALSGVA